MTDGDEPVVCPVCGDAVTEVSLHEEGLLVNLREDSQFRRVCVEPVTDDDGQPLVRLFQHPADSDDRGAPGTPGGRIP